MGDWRGLGDDYIPYTAPRPKLCDQCGKDSLTAHETHASDGYSIEWHCLPCITANKAKEFSDLQEFKRNNGIYDEHVRSLASLYTGYYEPRTNIKRYVRAKYKSEKLAAKRKAVMRAEYDFDMMAYFARSGTQPPSEYLDERFYRLVKIETACLEFTRGNR